MFPRLYRRRPFLAFFFAFFAGLLAAFFFAGFRAAFFLAAFFFAFFLGGAFFFAAGFLAPPPPPPAGAAGLGLGAGGGGVDGIIGSPISGSGTPASSSSS